VARRVTFTPQAWDNYLFWQLQDAKIVSRINDLIRECQRDPFRGIGKPEPLKRGLSGLWSRRIDQMLASSTTSTRTGSKSCPARYHYGDR
jgi:toxin YoeB